MLLLGIIILVMTIPLASLYLSTIFIHRFTLLTILYCTLLLYNVIYVVPLFISIGLLGELFQITILLQSLEILNLGGISLLFLIPEEYGIVSSSLVSEEFSILLFTSSFVPITIYSNTETAKSQILSDNKGKTGLYQWKHVESNKIYIGSAVDLSKRLENYYFKSYLERFKTIYIYNALLHHTHSAFSLSILEYIDITNLSSGPGPEEACELILSRKQHFLDLIFSEDEPNTYNILKIAGNLLGFKHTEETIARINKAQKGELHSMYGKSPSIETRTKSRITQGTTIFVYSKDDIFINSFYFIREAAKYYSCTHQTISRYLKSGKLFKNEWILSAVIK
jgi:group I intron endonuclease